MRRANGSGTIYKLSGKRRKPWACRVTTGYDEWGNQMRRIVGTYSTKREAETALATYLVSKAPRQSMTVKEAWDEWSEQFEGSPGTLNGYRSVYKRLKHLENTDLNDLSLDLLQPIFDGLSYGPGKALRNVLHNLLQYGFSHDCCSASRVALLQYLKLPKKIVKHARNAFTEEEVIDLIDQNAIGAVILICTGLRIDELLTLKEDDIHLEEQYLQIRKSKTAAGIRLVPIPDCIISMLRTYIADGMPRSQYMFNKLYWTPYELLKDRTRHECRHTYITMLTAAGVDQRIVKQLAGHSGSVTEDVYSHIPRSRKLEEVNRVFGKYFFSSSETAGIPRRQFRA